MSEAAKMRLERIERLIRELEYEVARGLMEREIEPRMGFQKIIPLDGNRYALIRFDVHPTTNVWHYAPDEIKPHLRTVK